ncbi:substrate-binding domain-containing protein [Bradyrhizobium sp. WSM 4400]|nr:substrate-binding domain-containing protein [Bradyrhizobium australafricanum]
MFVVPVDPVGISRAVQAATDARIPTFLCDGSIPGVPANSASVHNHFGMGSAAAEYICKRLKEKSKIAAIHLYSNEAWSARSDGMRFVLSGYPEIRVIAEIAYSLTGSATPRQAVEHMLTTHPDITRSGARGMVERSAPHMRSGRSVERTLSQRVLMAAVKHSNTSRVALHSVSQSPKASTSKCTGMSTMRTKCSLGGARHGMIINPAFAADERDLSRNVPHDYDRRGVADRLGWRRVP